MKRAVAGILLLVATAPAVGAGLCERQERTAVFAQRPVPVAIAPNEWTEVVFPEAVIGFLPERPEGLKSFGQEFGVSAERMFFTAEDGMYRGLALVHGRSGRTYHVEFIGRPSCADLTVRGEIAQIRTPKAPSEAEKSAGRKLLEYMVLGEEPPSYTRKKLDTALPDRLVLRQGSVKFYLSEIWEGRNYTGLVLLAVNEGRVPFRVALEAIDFSSPELKSVMGRVAELTMWPYNWRLEPAPEFAADSVHARNQGLLFVVAENFTIPGVSR